MQIKRATNIQICQAWINALPLPSCSANNSINYHNDIIYCHAEPLAYVNHQKKLFIFNNPKLRCKTFTLNQNVLLKEISKNTYKTGLFYKIVWTKAALFDIVISDPEGMKFYTDFYIK